MTIKLRIVGIFYGTEVDLGEDGGTVKDVLIAAQSAVTAGTSFTFGTTSFNGFESPSFFRAFYEAPVTSVSSGITYPAGEYLLSENLTAKPAYTVWQYYIADKNGTVLNRGKGFVPYDDPVDAKVSDGQSVVWRLLTVLSGPTGDTPPRLQKALTS